MSVTPQDFQICDWEAVVEESDRPLRQDYHLLFAKQESNARENGNSRAAKLFGLLKRLTFPYFDLDSEESPFPTLKKVEEGNLQTLSEVFGHINDAELRARIGDILWLHREQIKNGYQFALQAIDAYLEAAGNFEAADELGRTVKRQETVGRVRRAAQLARTLRNENKKDAVRTVAEDRLQQHATDKEGKIVAQFSGVLYENKLGDPEQQAEILEDVARSLENPTAEDKKSDYQTSRECWELAAKWHFRADDEASAHEARRRRAEALVKIAERHRPHLMAADFYNHALKILQSVPGSEERQENVRQAMVEVREQADVGKHIQLGSDLSNEEVQSKTEEEFKGLELEDALSSFAEVATIDEPEELRQKTKEMNQASPLQAMLAVTKHGSRNRKVAKKEGGLDDPDSTLDYQIHQTARRYWKWEVINHIEPAHQVIEGEHEIGVEELEPFFRDSPLIPPGRELSFATGLVAGFDGDYLTATHFLAVQLEESIRHLLRKKGVITTALKGEFEEEHNLNNFLKGENYQEDVTDLFGEELAWQLRSLLVDARGSNLRNKVAHALRSDTEYLRRVPSRFLWWLTWHMVVSPPSGVRTLSLDNHS